MMPTGCCCCCCCCRKAGVKPKLPFRQNRVFKITFILVYVTFSGPIHRSIGVVGFSSDLECDVTPALPDDQLLLVLWYKVGHNSPIYTYDARGKMSGGSASHYSNEDVFGSRANMRLPKAMSSSSEAKKARLTIERLRDDDGGLYKCRTDFKRSPTKNHRMELTILGE